VYIFSVQARCGQGFYGVKNGMQIISIAEVTYLLSVRLTVFRWHEFYLGLFMELGNLNIDVSLLLMLPLKDSQTNKREMHNRINLKAEYRCNIQGQTNS